MSVGPKELVYDEKFSPLMKELIALSKEHGISMFAHFVLDDPESDTTSCTTSIPQPEDEALMQKLKRLARGDSAFAMTTMTLITSKGDPACR